MRYNPVPPLVVGSLIGLGLALLNSCTVGPAQTMDTHTGAWEPEPVAQPAPAQQPLEPLYDEPIGPPAPGWQCDGQPCTDEQLQQLVDALETLEGTEP